MNRRAARTKPSVVEFLDRLPIDRCEFSLLRRYYCTLRRRNLGQTAAVIGALLALDFGQTEIADALSCRRRRLAGHWKMIRERFSLRGSGALVRFLHDGQAWPESSRSKPTPQERPFARVVPEAKPDSDLGRRFEPGGRPFGGGEPHLSSVPRRSGKRRGRSTRPPTDTDERPPSPGASPSRNP